jgi:uncharacterized protein YigA (DUF484 family)
MTKLDKFVAFARELPADRLERLEEVLDDLMHDLAPENDFTPEELAEIDRRLADAAPEMADPAEIEALLCRKLPG